MTDSQANLTHQIASLFSDYRVEELQQISADHVDHWVGQFPAEVRTTLLSELHHVFSSTYFSLSRITEFLTALATNKKLAGGDPRDFWQSAVLLDVQQRGSSQKHMLDVMRNLLCASFGDSVGKSNEGDTFVYLDDFLFSGQRILSDLTEWLRVAPSRGQVHIVYIGWHSYGQWRTEGELNKRARAAKKQLTFTWWSHQDLRLENRLKYRDSSDVLWPTTAPDSPLASQYEEKIQREGGKVLLRTLNANQSNSLFSSERNRQILEEQFLVAGLKIRAACREPKDIMRPLGFSPFPGFGFGALVANCWNCPNNDPLALWWGDPTASVSHPFSKWYPLLQRRTYEPFL